MKKNKKNKMGKKKKEHRKKVQARNQKLKRDESTLVNLLKKIQKVDDTIMNETEKENNNSNK